MISGVPGIKLGERLLLREECCEPTHDRYTHTHSFRDPNLPMTFDRRVVVPCEVQEFLRDISTRVLGG